MSKLQTTWLLMRSGKHIKQWRVKQAFKYQQKPRNFKCNKTCIPCKKTMNMGHLQFVLDTLETKLILTHSWDLPNTGYFHSKNWHWNLTDININQFGSSLIHEIDIVMLRVSASTNMVILISENWFEHRQNMVISISKDWHCDVTVLSIDKMWSFPFQKDLTL